MLSSRLVSPESLLYNTIILCSHHSLTHYVMMSVMSDADNMVSLVLGLIRVDYYNDHCINDDVLKAQLSSVSTDEDFRNLVCRIRSVIKVCNFV